MHLETLPIIKTFRARPRLSISIFIALTLFFLLPDNIHPIIKFLISWDCSALIYLILAATMMARSSTKKIRRRSLIEDEGRFPILLLNIIATISSIAAIIIVLSTTKSLPILSAFQHIILTIITIITSWCFIHTIFAIHYAHEYYMEYNGSHKKGLLFPGELSPGYWDFVYFSFILGTAAQTADIAITSKSIRATATVHCILAFFFNTAILALMINISAALLN